MVLLRNSIGLACDSNSTVSLRHIHTHTHTRARAHTHTHQGMLWNENLLMGLPSPQNGWSDKYSHQTQCQHLFFPGHEVRYTNPWVSNPPPIYSPAAPKKDAWQALRILKETSTRKVK